MALNCTAYAGVDDDKSIRVASTGSAEEVRNYFQDKDVNASFKELPSEYFINPVMVAARSNNVEAIIELAKMGADLNIVIENRTALDIAAKQRNIEAVKTLIEEGASVNGNFELERLIRLNNQNLDLLEPSRKVIGDGFRMALSTYTGLDFTTSFGELFLESIKKMNSELENTNAFSEGAKVLLFSPLYYALILERQLFIELSLSGIRKAVAELSPEMGLLEVMVYTRLLQRYPLSYININKLEDKLKTLPLEGNKLLHRLMRKELLKDDKTGICKAINGLIWFSLDSDFVIPAELWTLIIKTFQSTELTNFTKKTLAEWLFNPKYIKELNDYIPKLLQVFDNPEHLELWQSQLVIQHERDPNDISAKLLRAIFNEPISPESKLAVKYLNSTVLFLESTYKRDVVKIFDKTFNSIESVMSVYSQQKKILEESDCDDFVKENAFSILRSIKEEKIKEITSSLVSRIMNYVNNSNNNKIITRYKMVKKTDAVISNFLDISILVLEGQESSLSVHEVLNILHDGAQGSGLISLILSDNLTYTSNRGYLERLVRSKVAWVLTLESYKGINRQVIGYNKLFNINHKALGLHAMRIESFSGGKVLNLSPVNYKNAISSMKMKLLRPGTIH